MGVIHAYHWIDPGLVLIDSLSYGWLTWSSKSVDVRAEALASIATLRAQGYVDALLLPYPQSWDAQGRLNR